VKRLLLVLVALLAVAVLVGCSAARRAVDSAADKAISGVTAKVLE